MKPGQEVPSIPSPLELYRSWLPGGAWLLFFSVVAIIGGIAYHNVAPRNNILSELGLV